MPAAPRRYKKPPARRRNPGKDRKGPKIPDPQWPERPVEKPGRTSDTTRPAASAVLWTPAPARPLFGQVTPERRRFDRPEHFPLNLCRGPHQIEVKRDRLTGEADNRCRSERPAPATWPADVKGAFLSPRTRGGQHTRLSMVKLHVKQGRVHASTRGIATCNQFRRVHAYTRREGTLLSQCPTVSQPKPPRPASPCKRCHSRAMAWAWTAYRCMSCGWIVGTPPARPVWAGAGKIDHRHLSKWDRLNGAWDRKPVVAR